ncbi:hypothetical protein BDY19DRAFT_995175 [Irpex rosettiformis]|uniref:Uncharacterized protein n=1 Tax=Irpex rosettiformis TaxID=378272 RepID=A0ACB8TYF0_9APHY|nr:hypothetical protein BDY19DRAFT_995175 [Irpex rosettiformis]
MFEEEIHTKILHRDISIGNVMIGDISNASNVGLLGDWDHAAETNPEGDYKHQTFRTGTWPFMSIAMLRNPDKVHEILDDLEAIFWTFLYATLHRFRHTSTFNIEAFSWWEDEQCDGAPTGRVLGGQLKNEALPYIPNTVKFACKPLQNLITVLSLALYDYYNYVNTSSILNAVVDEDPTDVDARERYETVCAFRDRQHALLSKPAFWRKKFDNALKKGGWIDDISTDALYASRTAQKGDPAEQDAEEENPNVPPRRKEDDAYEVGIDENMDFPLILEADRDVNTLDPGPSSPLSSSYQTNIPPPSPPGLNSSQSEDNDSSPPSPSIMAANSRKRTLEDLEGASLSKRPRSDPDMPPPVLPLSRTRPTGGRISNSRNQRSGESSSGVAGPSGTRSGLRSRIRVRTPTERSQSLWTRRNAVN